MSPYKVLASNTQTSILAIEDALGRIHLGRTLVQPPPAGTPLTGPDPSIGLLLLALSANDAPITVALVMLDCDPELAVILAQDLAGHRGRAD